MKGLIDKLAYVNDNFEEVFMIPMLQWVVDKELGILMWILETTDRFIKKARGKA